MKSKLTRYYSTKHTIDWNLQGEISHNNVVLMNEGRTLLLLLFKKRD
jgi:hypothetical protein